jgi:hypothetical protein
MAFSEEISKKLGIDKSDIILYDHVFGFKNDYKEDFNSYYLYAESSKEIKMKLEHYIKNRKPFKICFVYPKALGKKVELSKEYKFNELKSLGYSKFGKIINISKSYWAIQFLNSEMWEELSNKSLAIELEWMRRLIKKGWE